MADEFDQSQSVKGLQRRTAEFQEAPGESEAEAAREAFLKGAGQQPGEVASSLNRVDRSLRASAVTRMQKERGNGYVQRVAGAGAPGAPGRLVGLSQPDMVSEVQRRKGSGGSLGGDARQNLENHFGADLSDVRIHTDQEAVTLNRELNAQAFTVGSDVFMGEGKFDPTSSEGQGLLAHELTHVGQQTGFGSQGATSAQREEMPEEEEVQREALPEEEELPGAHD
jgi:hypothetical protein